jgi:hypothetical protein
LGKWSFLGKALDYVVTVSRTAEQHLRCPARSRHGKLNFSPWGTANMRHSLTKREREFVLLLVVALLGAVVVLRL